VRRRRSIHQFSISNRGDSRRPRQVDNYPLQWTTRGAETRRALPCCMSMSAMNQ
jgi:hypothetical protein